MYTFKHFINIFSLLFICIIGAVYLYTIYFGFTNLPFLLTCLTIVIFGGAVILIGNNLSEKRKNEHPVKISDISISIIVVLSLLSVITIYFLPGEIELYLAAKFFMISVIMLSLIIFAENYLITGKINIRFFLFAFLSGLLIFFSTIFLIPFLIFTVYYFKNNILRLVTFSVTSLFLSVFFAFLVKSFSFGNYFVQEPSILNLFLFSHPIWFVFLIILISLIAGYLAADLQEVLFVSGIMLMIPAFYGLIEKMIALGFYYSLAISSTENFFLLFPLPFFILSIKYYKVDRFLGKVIN